MDVEPAPSPRLPWLAIASGAALALAALCPWAFREGLSAGLRPGVATAWTTGLAAFYLANALSMRWRAGLALAVFSGAAGSLMSYALAALVAIGGSVAMSAEAVAGTRAAMLVLMLIGVLHATLAGATLMALLHANRVLRSRAGSRPH